MTDYDPTTYFARPFVDVDEERAEPHPHRYVHGGFEGTTTRFSFYFPPADRYEGRFFQHVTPFPESEHLAPSLSGEEDRMAIAFTSGAYFVETNGGGNPFGPDAPPSHLVGAYDANAASAQYSRVVAEQVYGDGRRPYGYLYGGSGGGFRTIGAAEHTTGVWDGYVPHVIGSPMALPNVFSVRMHAQRVLADKLDAVADAYDAGGSGDPYPLLSPVEADALREVTAMGFPTRGWFGHRGLGTQAFSVIYDPMLMADPAYFDDFWTVPGYLGADPDSEIRTARVQFATTIAATLTEPELAALDLPELPHLRYAQQAAGGVDESFKAAAGAAPTAAVRLAEPVPRDTQGAELLVGDGVRLKLRLVKGDLAVLDIGNEPDALAALQPGTPVEVDNSNFLAAQTYHRHQVPPDGDFAVWDQFRDADGQAVHPQRPMVIGPMMSAGASGYPQSGAITGKMIVVDSLLDREAFPWQAAWYADQVHAHLGETADEQFRIWFTDNAVHGDVAYQGDEDHIVSYVGVLAEALRQVARWAETGTPPAASTAYRVDNGQVIVTAPARERGGVQPVVAISPQRVVVAPGEPVTFHACAETPDGVPLAAVHWDLDADGCFEDGEEITPVDSARSERTASFAEAGTHFVTVRAVAQRPQDAGTPTGRIANLARARVIVAPAAE
jgi:hypothetical protein